MTPAADAIRIRGRLRGDVAEVLVLMPHPMETGLRVDEAGTPVPAHFITEMVASVGERRVFAARLSIAVSRDPLVGFRFAGAAAGQRLRVSWTDSDGQQRTAETTLG